jgi:hypothetical protein
MLLVQTQMVFFSETAVYHDLSLVGLFGIKGACPTLKTVIGRKYSFQKLFQLSERNNVLDATTFNIHAFLCRGTCISSTHLNSHNGANAAYLPLQTAETQEVVLSTLTQFSHENSVLVI